MKSVVFTPSGGAQLLSSSGKLLWASDDDLEFMEEFDNDIIDPDSKKDLDALCDWLIELELLEEGEEFETDEQYIDDATGEVRSIEEDDEEESDAEDDDE